MGVIVLILMLIAATVYVAIRIVRLLVEKVFHRPIEHYGFVVCVVGGVFSSQLLGMAKHANESLCFCAFWVFAVLAVGFPGAYIFRRFRFPRGVAVAIMLGGSLGLSTGFFGASLDPAIPGDYPSWYQAPAALAAPGSIIAALGGLDECECESGGEEMWSRCHKIIILSNAIVWSAVAVAVGRAIHLVTWRYDASASLRHRPANAA